jgi:hypothetical protein
MLAKPPSKGAETSTFCALEHHEKLQPGAFYKKKKVVKENPVARKPENWTRLWEISERMVASKIGF